MVAEWVSMAASARRLYPRPVDNEQAPAKSARSLHPPNARQRSEALKERIYVTSTALAVTIAYERDVDRATVNGAAVTLLLTVLGTILAVLVADVIAHMMMYTVLPSSGELAHLGYVGFGASGVLVVPMGILGIGAAGVIDVATALRAISATLAVTLVVVTFIAVRRLRVGLGGKVLALSITAALGMTALCIELAVH